MHKQISILKCQMFQILYIIMTEKFTPQTINNQENYQHKELSTPQKCPYASSDNQTSTNILAVVIQYFP